MTLLRAYGFDVYDTMTEFHREPDQVNLSSFGSIGHTDIQTTTGRFLGGCLVNEPSSVRRGQIEFQIPDTQTVFVAFALKTDSWASTSSIFRINDDESRHMELQTDIGRRQISVEILGTPSGSFDFQHNVWNYVEIKLIVDNAVGEVTIRLNGIQVFSQTGIDTQSGSNATCNQITFVNNDLEVSATPVYRIDDLIIYDDQGAVNNAFMGDMEIQTLRPNADTVTVDFTPLAGSNFSNVDEAPGPDDDTTYVESSTPGDQDLYDIPSLQTQSTTVNALIVRSYVRKTDAGARSIRMLSQQNATLGTGAIQPMSSTYSYVNEIFELNPDTSLLWTVANINSAQIGMENV